MHPQTGKIIADGDMDLSMAYCYDRGGGQFTRLVPVDILPIDLKDIPRRVTTDEGMIVLPVPRMGGPGNQLANIQLEPQHVVTPPSSPNGGSTDPIQSRIDSIINATPESTNSALVLSNRGFDGPSGRALTQQHHGGGGGGGGGGNRREKIYCDKWIHDGTCAFTQQGCKYKHEMPHDRETQEKLGLFHGYPAWWKKQVLEQQRPLSIDDRPVSIGASRGSFPSLPSSGSLGGGLSSAVVSSNWRAAPSNVGEAGGSPTPTIGGSSSMLGRSGSLGFGGSGRSNARQPPSFQPPTYGPIGPPSRAGGSSTSGPGTTATRSTRSLTASSSADAIAPFQRAAFDTNNPFEALGDHTAQTHAPGDESSSGDTNTADGDEPRGAPL
ncbi:hypothetical protein Daus18300_002083 [Diaporthe australafricana]|uniref:C3H1-type domain-containing protein n=1 Tax=Diaporthe australafricana TaxID=127596 RepID=A0ABR3XRG4_9PEZI